MGPGCQKKQPSKLSKVKGALCCHTVATLSHKTLASLKAPELGCPVLPCILRMANFGNVPKDGGYLSGTEAWKLERRTMGTKIFLPGMSYPTTGEAKIFCYLFPNRKLNSDRALWGADGWLLITTGLPPSFMLLQVLRTQSRRGLLASPA